MSASTATPCRWAILCKKAQWSFAASSCEQPSGGSSEPTTVGRSPEHPGALAQASLRSNPNLDHPAAALCGHRHVPVRDAPIRIPVRVEMVRHSASASVTRRLIEVILRWDPIADGLCFCGPACVRHWTTPRLSLHGSSEAQIRLSREAVNGPGSDIDATFPNARDRRDSGTGVAHPARWEWLRNRMGGGPGAPDDRRRSAAELATQTLSELASRRRAGFMRIPRHPICQDEPGSFDFRLGSVSRPRPCRPESGLRAAGVFPAH